MNRDKKNKPPPEEGGY